MRPTRPLLIAALAALSACASATPNATPEPHGSAPSTAKPSAITSATPTIRASVGATPKATTDAPRAPQGARTDPPAPGTYAYRQSGTTKYGAFTLNADPEGTLDVGAPDGKRQTQVRAYSDSRSREQVFDFDAGAVRLIRTTQRTAGQEIPCELDDPLTVIDHPLEAGASWKDDARCGDIAVSIDARVLRNERRRVGAATIPTWVLRVVLTANGGGIEQTTTATTWISPDYRLSVRTIEHATGTFQGQPFTADMTEDLVSLSPR